MADPKTILVIDDDHELSEGLRLILEKNGFKVLQANNGVQGKKQN